MLGKCCAAVAALSVAVVVPLTGTSASALSTRTSLDRTIVDNRVVESSGLTRSTYTRSVLWTHNDSGGENLVFAIGAGGATRATVTLAGVRPRDWEDIAAGPDHKLWVGDVGNNRKTRTVIRVYRFTEPRTLTDRTVRPKRFDLVYPDGRHNSEGIMVHPRTGRLYVVTKSITGGAIYAAPPVLSRTRTNRLSKVAFAPTKISGASFSRDGSRFALTDKNTAWVYRSVGGRGVAIDKPNLRAGESIAFSRAGTRLYMGSEGPDSPVYRVALPTGLT